MIHGRITTGSQGSVGLEDRAGATALAGVLGSRADRR